MALQTISVSKVVAVTRIISYLSPDFSVEIDRQYPDCDYTICQVSQSSSYTSGDTVTINTTILVDLVPRELRKSA